MSTKRILLTILAASAVLAAVGIGPQFIGSARALPPAQAGVTIPYSGRLSNQAGGPVADGAYDFTFALYAAQTGGEPVWTETHKGVAVQGGAFTVLLGRAAPLPQEVLDGGARWLEVGVRGPGEAEYTRLSPRQELSAAAPVAQVGAIAPAGGGGLSCAHTHWGETWSGSGPNYGLTLYSNSDTYAALRASDTSPNGGFGVFADSYHGTGVYGYASAATGETYGVYGQSASTFGRGVYGRSDGAFGRGVYGYAAATSGTNYGVYGQSNSPDGVGVYGYASATSGPNLGVYGRSNSPDGYGVYAYNSSGIGIYASGGGSARTGQPYALLTRTPTTAWLPIWRIIATTPRLISIMVAPAKYSTCKTVGQTLAVATAAISSGRLTSQRVMSSSASQLPARFAPMSVSIPQHRTLPRCSRPLKGWSRGTFW